MLNVTFLGHSGFLVQARECALIFDYYTGDIPPLPAGTNLYVFVSHSHHDHFNPDIFKLAGQYPKTTYILSNEVNSDGQPGVYPVKPDQHLTLPHLNLTTTGSTDQGVAFLVSLNSGEQVFHAGDLNWWTWPGEESEKEFAEMSEKFKQETGKLAGQKIDLAFLPLDPRQQDRFYWGFDYYMKHLDIARAYPMHFWGKDEVIDRLLKLEDCRDYRPRIGILRKNGDTG